MFVAALNDEPISNGSAEEKINNLIKRVAQACDTCMPRKRGMNQRPPVHWWNDYISSLRKECLKKSRISQRGYRRPNSAELVAEYKSAQRCLNKAIKDSKKNCWKELINEVDKDLWGRPYKVVMAHLKYQPIPSPTCPQLLLKTVTALFLRQRKFIYTSQQLNPEDIPLVTKEELMEACNRVGNNKAPGLDGVPNIALKKSIKAAPELFLDVYNTCLKEGTFPRKWKQQRLVLLPKGKKPPEEPSANNQYEFRRGRSTLDAINLVVYIAKDAIAGTRWKGGTKEYCLVAALDIRNAFNSASWVCIMQALRGENVPEYLCRIVASYFTDRVLKYDTKNDSKEYDITEGVS
ncbi:Putative 115 kDa protein in type-1 retrotransposable element R1DM [Eumeta japonica]|uniref:115 kDa protein in type-1 retrotransposable element R1DM n=1 Tax=Eumeta variegata TaxID=151549 RepID=A0A4C2A6D8_EUMVA|nr:Putative 115 kDa protein in type-1 retrotransposable element R1DM [Eumeta japonica]